MKKHTKGEWKLRFFADKDDGECDFFVEAPNLNKPNLGYGIEIMQDDYGEHNGYPREQRLADAKLIAASPEMLEALCEAKRMYEELQPAGGWQGVYEQITSVIKKAIG
jgi:hypothetical protein